MSHSTVLWKSEFTLQYSSRVPAPPCCSTDSHVAVIFQGHLLGGELCSSLTSCDDSACCLSSCPVPSSPWEGLAMPVCVPVVFLCYHTVAWANLSNAHRDTVLPCGSSDIHAACHVSMVPGHSLGSPVHLLCPGLPSDVDGSVSKYAKSQRHCISAPPCLFIHVFLAWINMLQPIFIGCFSCCELTL